MESNDKNQEKPSLQQVNRGPFFSENMAPYLWSFAGVLPGLGAFLQKQPLRGVFFIGLFVFVLPLTHFLHALGHDTISLAHEIRVGVVLWSMADSAQLALYRKGLMAKPPLAELFAKALDPRPFFRLRFIVAFVVLFVSCFAADRLFDIPRPYILFGHDFSKNISLYSVILILLTLQNTFTAIGEESFFRSFLQRNLCIHTQKPLFAIALSSLLFGLCHLGLGFAAILIAIALSFLLGFLFHSQKSMLGVGVFAHSIWNVASDFSHWSYNGVLP